MPIKFLSWEPSALPRVAGHVKGHPGHWTHCGWVCKQKIPLVQLFRDERQRLPGHTKLTLAYVLPWAFHLYTHTFMGCIYVFKSVSMDGLHIRFPRCCKWKIRPQRWWIGLFIHSQVALFFFFWQVCSAVTGKGFLVTMFQHMGPWSTGTQTLHLGGTWKLFFGNEGRCWAWLLQGSQVLRGELSYVMFPFAEPPGPVRGPSLWALIGLGSIVYFS